MQKFNSQALLASVASVALFFGAQTAYAQLPYGQSGYTKNTAPNAQTDSQDDGYQRNNYNNAYSGAANWTGPYAGVNFGGVIGEYTNESGKAGPGGTGGGVTPGAQIGYNWQNGNVVYGGEADASWIPFQDRFAGGRYDENWLSTIRGRLGYAMGNFLPFMTAGLALTGTETAAAGGGANSNVHTGLALGGGAEYMYNSHWSMKGEYLYADAPTESSTINGVPYAGGSANHIFRVGLNYHFY